MTSFKTTRSSVIKTTLLGVSVMAVAACSNYGPYPLATGYKYQQQEYKSAAGPEPVIEKYTRRDQPAITTQAQDIAPDVTPAPVQNMTFHWNRAADELVSRLVTNLGLPMETVYVAAPSNPEEAGLATALARALQNHNIAVMDRNDGAPFGAAYKISVLDIGQPDRRLITLQLISAGQVVHEESGIYTVV